MEGEGGFGVSARVVDALVAYLKDDVKEKLRGIEEEVLVRMKEREAQVERRGRELDLREKEHERETKELEVRRDELSAREREFESRLLALEKKEKKLGGRKRKLLPRERRARGTEAEERGIFEQGEDELCGDCQNLSGRQGERVGIKSEAAQSQDMRDGVEGEGHAGAGEGEVGALAHMTLCHTFQPARSMGSNASEENIEARGDENDRGGSERGREEERENRDGLDGRRSRADVGEEAVRRESLSERGQKRRMEERTGGREINGAQKKHVPMQRVPQFPTVDARQPTPPSFRPREVATTRTALPSSRPKIRSNRVLNAEKKNPEKNKNTGKTENSNSTPSTASPTPLQRHALRRVVKGLGEIESKFTEETNSAHSTPGKAVHPQFGTRALQHEKLIEMYGEKPRLAEGIDFPVLYRLFYNCQGNTIAPIEFQFISRVLFCVQSYLVHATPKGEWDELFVKRPKNPVSRQLHSTDSLLALKVNKQAKQALLQRAGDVKTRDDAVAMDTVQKYFEKALEDLREECREEAENGKNETEKRIAVAIAEGARAARVNLGHLREGWVWCVGMRGGEMTYCRW